MLARRGRFSGWSLGRRSASIEIEVGAREGHAGMTRFSEQVTNELLASANCARCDVPLARYFKLKPQDRQTMKQLLLYSGGPCTVQQPQLQRAQETDKPHDRKAT